jgi:DHA3 family multidrug efflux protein-like MFS transporter
VPSKARQGTITTAAVGFGGAVVAAKGLGRNPIRTLLLAVALMGVLGAVFTLRDWWWLYAGGIWLYMMLIPVVESAEQTVIQKVVPFEKQGRVFGAATALEVVTGRKTQMLWHGDAEVPGVEAVRSLLT